MCFTQLKPKTATFNVYKMTIANR